MSDVNPLTAEQKAAFLTLLARGASPMVACREIGVEYSVFLETMRCDDSFSTRVDEVQQLLTRNVAAALYKSALEGKVGAQTFYLRHYDKRPVMTELTDDLSDFPIEDLARMLQSEWPDVDDPTP